MVGWSTAQHNFSCCIQNQVQIFFSDFKYFCLRNVFLHNSNFFFAKSRTYLNFQEINLLIKEKRIIDIYFFCTYIYKKRELDSKKGINIYRKINCLRTHKSSLGTLKYSSRAISIYTSDRIRYITQNQIFRGYYPESDKKYYYDNTSAEIWVSSKTDPCHQYSPSNSG